MDENLNLAESLLRTKQAFTPVTYHTSDLVWPTLINSFILIDPCNFLREDVGSGLFTMFSNFYRLIFVIHELINIFTMTKYELLYSLIWDFFSILRELQI